MDRESKDVQRFLMDRDGINASEAKAQIKKMSDDDFAALVAKMPEPTVATNAKVVAPELISVNGEIIEINPINIVAGKQPASAITISTVDGKPITFVVTNVQLGTEERRGFALKVGKIAEFTLEKRIAGVTTYLDDTDQVVKPHEKSGYGFSKSSAIKQSVFDGQVLMSQLERVPDSRLDVMANALLRQQELTLKYASKASVKHELVDAE